MCALPRCPAPFSILSRPCSQNTLGCGFFCSLTIRVFREMMLRTSPLKYFFPSARLFFPWRLPHVCMHISSSFACCLCPRKEGVFSLFSSCIDAHDDRSNRLLFGGACSPIHPTYSDIRNRPALQSNRFRFS